MGAHVALGGARLPDSVGLGQLARLLQKPGAEVTATELAGQVGMPAAGLGPALDAQAKRARVNVVRSLRRAIAAIALQADGLGAHLDVSVRTGRYCGYLPEPAAALSWTVES